MTWVLGWPLDSDYAIQLSKDLKLVERSNANDDDHFVAGTNHIASEAHWEHVLLCWVGEDLQMVFGAYVDERRRAFPPKRIAMSRAVHWSRWDKLGEYIDIERRLQWYRYQDGSWNPYEGEKWPKYVYMGEDDDLVDYGLVGECDVGQGPYEGEGDSSDEELFGEEGEYDEECATSDSDHDTEVADASSVSSLTASIVIEKDGESAATLAPQFETQCTI